MANKGFTPNQANGKQAHQPQSESPSDPVADVQQQAKIAIEGLEQAGLAHAGQAIQRHLTALEADSEQLASTLAVLLDPDFLLALAEIKAARKVNDRVGKYAERQIGGFPSVSLEIPALPSLSRFYQPSQPSCSQLASTSSATLTNNLEGSES